jgi:hypothetical protein
MGHSCDLGRSERPCHLKGLPTCLVIWFWVGDTCFLVICNPLGGPCLTLPMFACSTCVFITVHHKRGYGPEC